MKDSDILAMFSEPSAYLVSPSFSLKKDNQALKFDVIEQRDQEVKFLDCGNGIKGVTDGVGCRDLDINLRLGRIV